MAPEDLRGESGESPVEKYARFVQELEQIVEQHGGGQEIEVSTNFHLPGVVSRRPDGALLGNETVENNIVTTTAEFALSVYKAKPNDARMRFRGANIKILK